MHVTGKLSSRRPSFEGQQQHKGSVKGKELASPTLRVLYSRDQDGELLISRIECNMLVVVQ